MERIRVLQTPEKRRGVERVAWNKPVARVVAEICEGRRSRMKNVTIRPETQES
jgi:hypothetical protein